MLHSMLHYFQTIFSATKVVLHEKMYRYFTIPTAVIFFAFFLAIPIVAIPSNTLELQLSLLTATDYVTLTALAILGSLFLLMNIYAYKQSKQNKAQLGVMAESGFGGVSATFASIFGAASCPMCVASLFGFLGFGAVGFLVRYQVWVFVASLFLMLIPLYLTSKKVVGICNKC